MALDEKKLLEDLLKGYKAAVNYAKGIWDQRIEDFNLLKGKSKKRRYKSEANFHVPYAETLLQNVYPLLVARLPEPSVAARNFDKDKDGATLNQELVKYTFDVERFEKKFLETTLEAMELDTGWLEVGWKYQNKETDHPCYTVKDTFNIFVHPNKEDLDDDWPIYERALMSKADMKKQGWDVSKVSKLGKNFLESEEYKEQKLQTLGYNTNTNALGEELYEVIKIWLKMNLSDDENGEKEMALVVIANQQEIINTKPFKGKKLYQSPYDHGMFPLIPLPYSPGSHLIYGESFIRPVADQQRELSALENMKADNYKRRNSPPIKYKKSTGIDLSTLRFETAAPWGVQNMDDIQFMIIEDLAISIGNQQEMIRRVMQDRTGANDILLVTNDVAIKGGDTATGASIANENTKLRFRPQAIHIDFFIKRVGEITIALFQQPDLFDREMAVAIADEEGNFYEKTIKPEDIKGSYQYIVTSGSSLAESDEQRVMKFANLKNLYAEDQSINQEVFDKPLLTAAGIDYSKARVSKEEGLAQLTMKLKELIALTKQPGFQQQPDNVKSKILAQIDNIKQMLQGGEQPQGMESVIDGQQGTEAPSGLS